MPVRHIYSFADPVLRQKARPVGRIDKATQRLIDDMIETMRAAEGIGLAA
ncbi:MAG TPA: peptide deformylase, partial [Chloroflexota bacterium]|nr:peptide deformylase [Chloroflexota bacterium]